jgi:hypothetical protein
MDLSIGCIENPRKEIELSHNTTGRWKLAAGTWELTE